MLICGSYPNNKVSYQVNNNNPIHLQKKELQIMKKNILAFTFVLHMSVCFAMEVVYPEEYSDGLAVNAKLNKDDGTVNGNMYCSLTSGYQYYNWSDGEAITGSDTTKIYYIPSGMMACTAAINQDVVPIIYSSGRVYSRAGSNKTTTFNDLRLLGGGCLEHRQMGKKMGNITIQACNPNNPALLCYAFPEIYDHNIVADKLSSHSEVVCMGMVIGENLFVCCIVCVGL